MLRDIPEATKVEVDNIFGSDGRAMNRRFSLAFRSINGWDLDRMKADRENCVVLPGLIVGVLLQAIGEWLSIG